MMHLQAIIPAVILLLTDPVHPFPEVSGLPGHSVTLPCTYPASNEFIDVCWGSGACLSRTCGQTLIWTNKYLLYHRANERYQLKGQILQGNVSLTIENAAESDSGRYCCRVAMRSGVQTLTISLQVQSESPSSPPERPTMITHSTATSTKPTTTIKHTTSSPSLTDAPTRLSASTPATPTHPQTHKSDLNSSVTSSDLPCNNHSGAFPTRKPSKEDITKISVGVSIALLLVLFLASVPTIAKYYHRKKKSLSLAASHVSKIGAFQNTAVMLSQGEDKVYILEGSLHVKY